MKRIVFFLALLSTAFLGVSVSAVAAGLNSTATSGLITLSNGQELGFFRQGASKTLGNGADYLWWYGCAPTSAGMMMAYYDRNGYAGASYPNLVPGGVAEATDGPLAHATIASSRHISDFYIGDYGTGGDDLPGAPTGALNCLADYMGTNQDACGNVNSSTAFFYMPNGSRLTVADVYAMSVADNYPYYDFDGMYGVYEYVKYFAGYDLGAPGTCTSVYTQPIKGYNGNTLGFTWEDYKAEIDAGRPVMIQVEGHSMYGYGYDDDTDEIILHDTWSVGEHRMTWGGSYSEMAQWGVVCFTIPEPSTIVLLGLGGLIGIVVAARRRRG
jgi:hypothetical protein